MSTQSFAEHALTVSNLDDWQTRYPMPKPPAKVAIPAQAQIEAQQPGFMSRMSSWFSSWWRSPAQTDRNPPTLYSSFTWSSVGNSIVAVGGATGVIWGAVKLSQGDPVVGGVLIAVALLVELVWASRVHVIITESQSYNALAQLGASTVTEISEATNTFVEASQLAYAGLANSAGQCLGKMQSELDKAELDRKQTEAAIKAEVVKLQDGVEQMAVTASSNHALFQNLARCFTEAQQKREATLRALKDENRQKDVLLNSLGSSIATLKAYTKDIATSRQIYESLETILEQQGEQLQLLDSGPNNNLTEVIASNSKLQTLVTTILNTLLKLQNLPKTLEKLNPDEQMNQLLKIQQSVQQGNQTLQDQLVMQGQLNAGIQQLQQYIEKEVAPLSNGQEKICGKLNELNRRLAKLSSDKVD